MSLFWKDIEEKKAITGNPPTEREKFALDKIKKEMNVTNIHITGGTNDAGLDAYILENNQNYAFLFQFKCVNPDTVVRKNIIVNHEAEISKLINTEENHKLKANDGVEAFIEAFNNSDIKYIKCYFITSGRYTNFAKNKVKEIGGKKVKFTYINRFQTDWFVSELSSDKKYRDYVLGKSGILNLDKDKYIVHDKEKITLETTSEEIIKFAFSFVKTRENLKYLTHKNVRNFLGTKNNDINTSIVETIQSKEDAKNVISYHMGIVVTCDDLILDKEKNTLTLFSPSFINGAQTLSAIAQANNDKRLVKDTKFNLKVIKTSKTEIENNIVLRSNSSNPISWKMKYNFDEKQRQIHFLLKQYNVHYKLKFSDDKAIKKDTRDVKKYSKIFKKDNVYIKTMKSIQSTDTLVIEPIFLAQCIRSHIFYDPVLAGNSGIQLKYDPIVETSEIYNETFFNKDNLKIVGEYMEPLLIGKVFLQQISKVFPTSKQQKLDIDKINNICKLNNQNVKILKWVLISEWSKKQKDKDYSFTDAIINDTLKDDVKAYLKKQKKDLEDKDVKTNELKKALFDNNTVLAVAKNWKQK